MSSTDIILVLILGLFMVSGWRSGLLKKLIALVSLGVGLIVATKYASAAGEELTSPLNLSPGTAATVAFLLIVALIMLAQALFYRFVIKKLAEGLWNKIAGLLLGLVEGAMLLSVLLIFLGIYFHYPAEETRSASALYKPIKNVAPRVFDSINTFFPESADFYQEIISTGAKKLNQKEKPLHQ